MQLDALSVGRAAALLSVLALLLGLLLLVVLARQRSSSRSRATATDEGPGASGPSSSEGGVVDTPEPELSPRVIAVYVRTLEATLAEQDERLHEVERCAERRHTDNERRQAERVRCTLLAMRERLVDQPGEVVLNRIETALARLGSDPGTARPKLTAAPSGSAPVAFAAARDRVPVEELSTQEAEAPRAMPDAEPEPAPDHPGIDAPVAQHRVMPVPAPMQTAERSRSRRRFGRSRVS